MSEDFLKGTPGFVVDVNVASGNVIKISLDNDNSTSIENCMALSRHIEGSFDREEEDFSLDVGSPGLDQPLKILRQYKKLIGKQVMVLPRISTSPSSHGRCSASRSASTKRRTNLGPNTSGSPCRRPRPWPRPRARSPGPLTAVARRARGSARPAPAPSARPRSRQA